MKIKYKYYHRILGFLYEEWKENNKEDKLVGSIRISDKTKIPISVIHDLQYVLLNNGDISTVNNDGQSMMSIQQMGITSFVDKKYLKECEKEFWDGIFNWARIIIPLGALRLSIINYISNNSLKSKIEQLEFKSNKIESKK